MTQAMATISVTAGDIGGRAARRIDVAQIEHRFPFRVEGIEMPWPRLRLADSILLVDQLQAGIGDAIARREL